MPTLYKPDVPPSAAETRQLILEHEEAIAKLKKYLDALRGIQSLKARNGHHATGISEVPRVKNPTSVKIGAPTGLKQAAREFAPKLHAPFTVSDFVGKLHGVTFRGDERNSIRDAVTSLCKDKFLELVEAGKGGKPNTYKVRN